MKWMVVYRQPNRLLLDTLYYGPFESYADAYEFHCGLPALEDYDEESDCPNHGVKYVQELKEPKEAPKEVPEGLIPEGFYTIKIISVERKISKTYNPYLHCEISCEEEPRIKTMALGRTRYTQLYLKQFGNESMYDPNNVEWLVGKRFEVKCKHEKIKEVWYSVLSYNGGGFVEEGV